MKIAVISLTGNGRILSGKIAAGLGSGHSVTRFCHTSHSDDDSVPFDSLNSLTERIFGSYDALVFLCAVGIAVRVCAPHIVSKLSDPAAVVVDDTGKFAVSLFSGHIGGANALAGKIAELIDATPVITTATDRHGLFSPDIFAKQNRLVICDMNAAKAVAAAVVNGEKVGVVCRYTHGAVPPELTECTGGSIGICITDKADDRPFDTSLVLMPENLVAGIGCKKGNSEEKTEEHIAAVFSANGLDIRRLSAAATIDIKADEPGLNGFCKTHGITLRTFSAEELMRAEGEFTHSDFVEKTTGADNVCERAAVCAGGRLIVPKTCGGGVTAAVAELAVNIDFERKDDLCFI